MIPNHLLTDLTPDDRIAVLSRGGEIHFLVHPVADDPEVIRAYAEREGSRVLRSHLRDPEVIRAVAAGRERDIGGEG
ncbi:MAG TPA: hypothetical protein VH092_36300 [Urbifossiella sp.]|jgi:hypothetical protein|nr:hypothetical protein [Urbifossiella sp.]